MRTTTGLDLDSRIVQLPQYYIRLKDSAPVRLHVSATGGGLTGGVSTGAVHTQWTWAILLRAVGGWEVIAGSVLDTSDTPLTHAQFAQGIADRYGDGYAQLAPENNCVARTTGVACLYGPDGTTSYCGALVRRPAVLGTSKPGHVTQHCIECKNAYRAAHYGRTPVTH